MGLFDELAGKAMGVLGGAGSEQSGLMQGVLEMLGSSESGGLSGLVNTFKEKGLGEVVSSWVGTGQNLPINAEQIQQVLGGDAIQQLAAKAGLSTDEVSSKLAEHLPGIVDHLTPDGSVPEGGLLAQGLGFLRGKMS